MTTKMISIRIPEESIARIDERADAADMSRSAWMIEASLNYQKVDADDELDDIRKRLSRLEDVAGL